MARINHSRGITNSFKFSRGSACCWKNRWRIFEPHRTLQRQLTFYWFSVTQTISDLVWLSTVAIYLPLRLQKRRDFRRQLTVRGHVAYWISSGSERRRHWGVASRRDASCAHGSSDKRRSFSGAPAQDDKRRLHYGRQAQRKPRVD